MKRAAALLSFVVLMLAIPLAVAAPVVRVINGNPLTVNIGDDASFQVYTTLVPGQGQFYPSGATQTADMGVFARSGGVLYAPDFNNHPGGTATGGLGARTAWTPVSISPVTGTGTAADPFTVVVVDDAAASGLRLTMTVTYVNGENFFRKSLVFSSTNGAQTFDAFLGGDIYLAASDAGVPFFSSGAVGGQNCGPNPPAGTYTILFIPLVPAPADRYTARGYSQVWSEIGSGAPLTNTIAAGCQDNGAALEWQNRSIAATSGTVTITAATSFGAIPPIVTPPPASGPVDIPTLTEWGLIVLSTLVAGLAIVSLRRRASH